MSFNGFLAEKKMPQLKMVAKNQQRIVTTTHLRSGDVCLLHNKFDIIFFYSSLINLQITKEFNSPVGNMQ